MPIISEYDGKIQGSRITVIDNIKYLQADSAEVEGAILVIGPGGQTALRVIPDQDTDWQDTDSSSVAVTSTWAELLSIVTNKEIVPADGYYQLYLNLTNGGGAFGADTLYIRVKVDGVVVSNMDGIDFISGESERAIVRSGMFASTITSGSTISIEISCDNDNLTVNGDIAASVLTVTKAAATVTMDDLADYATVLNLDLVEDHSLKYQRGWDRLGDADSLGDITWDSTAKTFTIAPKSGESSFSFWCAGTKFVKTSSMSISLTTSSSGAFYVVFDSSGALAIVDYDNVSQSSFMNCITGLYYWNNTDSVLWTAKDEQHGIIYDPMVHFQQHFCHGYCWPGSGSEAEGFADASDTFTKITSGAMIDEDIVISHSDLTTLPFGYKMGSDGHWVFTTADNKVGYIESGNTYVSYNKNTSGTWSLDESGSASDYIIYVIMATNFTGLDFFKVIGQQWYSSRSAAREALYDHIHAINLSGTPGAEAKPCYAYICKRNGDIEDSGSPLYEAIIDLRGKHLT